MIFEATAFFPLANKNYLSISICKVEYMFPKIIIYTRSQFLLLSIYKC